MHFSCFLNEKYIADICLKPYPLLQLLFVFQTYDWKPTGPVQEHEVALTGQLICLLHGLLPAI